MATFTKSAFILAGIIAMLLQLPIVQRFIVLLRLGLAIGKVIQPISDFSYQCRRIQDPRLEACEDLWLSEATRQLFLACSDSQSRDNWQPNEGQFNLNGRSTRDAIVVMNPETLEFKELPITGYTGTDGDGVISIVGFTGIDKPDGSIELFLTNFRPSIDLSSGQVLPDQAAVGANATIEVFKIDPRIEGLQYVQTLADPAIMTPNRIAAVPDRGLYITNDHGLRKTGLMSRLSPLLKTGNVAFCPIDSPDPCEIVSTGHSYPNGLIHSRLDDRIYLPSSAAGGVKVLTTYTNNSVELLHEIDVPYAIDNLSEDRNGDIWVAVITKGIDFIRSAKSPFTIFPPSSVFKIQRTGSETYTVTKVLEDRDGEALPGTTTVIHDATTGKLFLGGTFSPFITVCQLNS